MNAKDAPQKPEIDWGAIDRRKKPIVSTAVSGGNEANIKVGDTVILLRPVFECGRIGVVKQVSEDAFKRLYVEWESGPSTRIKVPFQKELYWVGANDVKLYTSPASAEKFLLGEIVVSLVNSATNTGATQVFAGQVGMVKEVSGMSSYTGFVQDKLYVYWYDLYDTQYIPSSNKHLSAFASTPAWINIKHVKRYVEPVTVDDFVVGDTVVLISPAAKADRVVGRTGVIKMRSPNELYIYCEESGNAYSYWVNVRDVKRADVKKAESSLTVEKDAVACFCSDDCRKAYREDRMAGVELEPVDMDGKLLSFKSMCERLKLCCYCEGNLK